MVYKSKNPAFSCKKSSTASLFFNSSATSIFIMEAGLFQWKKICLTSGCTTRIHNGAQPHAFLRLMHPVLQSCHAKLSLAGNNLSNVSTFFFCVV